MKKVNQYPNWKKIIFTDRAILKTDLKYLSANQQQNLNNLNVRRADNNGKTLYV